METNFTGKRALVTGAGQGIGRETAKKLAECGAKVVALSRTREHLDSLAAENPSIDVICVDLADWEETRKCVMSLGDVDLLVNNAAVALLEPFLSIEPKNIDRSFDVNVKAVINVSQIIAKGMISRKTGGSIVNISSQASQAALQDHSVYCATKGALDMLSKVMALELGPHKIRVNCVNPTVVMTAMGKIGWSNPEKANPMLKKIPLGRFAEVHEVVDAILFLLSDKADMITGITLPVDGGFLAC
ncbi:L-xylulose reductase [Ischnura elegans]|uniref:L-xylulose reductase n=1 Tax=Ischnura elegans TaxID=197161 RepID=UPI001ED8BF1C|nr:L-xylulose reductase [Ischnura elegans]